MTTRGKWISRHRSSVRLVLLAGGGIFLLAALLPRVSHLVETSPPSLKGCTRIDVEYRPSALQHLTTSSSVRNLLSPQEAEYLQSFQVHVVTDSHRIDAFARNVKTATYMGPAGSPLPSPMYITCYRGDRRMMSFLISGRHLGTENRLQFEWPLDSDIITPIDAAEVHPFRLRVACATNLIRLRNMSHVFDSDVVSYPEPNLWADCIVAHLRRSSDQWISRCFRCPGANQNRSEESPLTEAHPASTSEQSGLLLLSDYAVNSACGLASPPDTILLFETKRGWNQHGGPELFTFDNHDPRGGVVLLNDGTVKFIRTEEELRKLRWK